MLEKDDLFTSTAALVVGGDFVFKVTNIYSSIVSVNY